MEFVDSVSAFALSFALDAAVKEEGIRRGHDAAKAKAGKPRLESRRVIEHLDDSVGATIVEPAHAASIGIGGVASRFGARDRQVVHEERLAARAEAGGDESP